MAEAEISSMNLEKNLFSMYSVGTKKTTFSFPSDNYSTSYLYLNGI